MKASTRRFPATTSWLPVDLDRLLADVLSTRPDADRNDLIEAVRAANPLITGDQLNRVVERAWQRAHGLGPVGVLLVDPTITEVMINGPGSVWVDRSEGLTETDIRLSGHDLQLLIERIVDPIGLRVDRVSPIVDARLADGSRVNIVVPPLAVDGPYVTIRRFPSRPIALERFGSTDLIAVLASLMTERRNLVISGGTGAGKTTLLNGLGSFLSEGERVVVIEDIAELQLPGPHVVRMETRPPNSEGVGGVSMRELVRNALRMRPDRIVVGEVRGGEALDLLLALNTGHRGTLTTCHANNPRAAIDRLVTLALMGGIGLTEAAIERQLAGAIDAVVQVERSAHRREVVEIGLVESEESGGHPRLRTIWQR